MRISAIIAASCLSAIMVGGFVVGCSSDSSSPGGGTSDPCAAGTSKCANDTKPSADDQAKATAACKAEVAGSCSTQYKLFVACAQSKQTCTADGKTDGAALLAACKAEYDAYAKCKTPPADAGAETAPETGGETGGDAASGG